MNPENNSLLAQHRYQTNILNELGVFQWVHNDSSVIELSEFLSKLPEQQTFDAGSVIEEVQETQEIELINQKAQLKVPDTSESVPVVNNQENQVDTHQESEKVQLQVAVSDADGRDTTLESLAGSDETPQTSEQAFSNEFDAFLINNNHQFEINGLVIPINGKQVVLVYSSDIDDIENMQSQLWESLLNAVKLQSNNDGFNAVKYAFPMMQHTDTHTLENAIAGLAGWVTSIEQESNMPMQLFLVSLNEASIPLKILKEAINTFELNVQVKSLPSINEMLQNWQTKRSAWEAIVSIT